MFPTQGWRGRSVVIRTQGILTLLCHIWESKSAKVHLSSHALGTEGKPREAKKFCSLWKTVVRDLPSRRYLRSSQIVQSGHWWAFEHSGWKIHQCQHFEEEIETDAELVARELRNKKADEASTLQQVLQIANKIEVHAANLVRESVVCDAQKVIELVEDMQELVTEEASKMLKSTVEVQSERGTSGATASEDTRGNSPSHNISNSITDLDSSSTSSSSETSSTSSPYTKIQKKHVDDTYVPMYPSVQERIDNMIRQTIDVSQRLPENHLFRHGFLNPIQTILLESDTNTSTSSPPQT